MLTWKTLAN